MPPLASLILLTAESRPAAAHFLARLNPLPKHQVCYLGTGEGEIASDLDVVLPPEGYSLGAKDAEGNLVGFLGVEMDPALSRAWLFGPFVEAHDWHGLADQLYRAALERLPPEILDQELCGHLDNGRLAEFARRHGFKAGAPSALLVLPRPSLPPSETGASGPDAQPPQAPQVAEAETASPGPLASPQPAVDSEQPAAPQFQAQDLAGGALAAGLEALHNQLFPNTYFSAAQLIAMSAETDKRLMIEQVDGRLAGYIFLQARPASRDAYIDFLGVAEPFRRRGLAGRLLSRALDWVFARPFVEEVTLTVHTSNIAALALYEAAGFQMRHTLVGYRKRPS